MAILSHVGENGSFSTFYPHLVVPKFTVGTRNSKEIPYRKGVICHV